jgi:hypothetical protein
LLFSGNGICLDSLRGCSRALMKHWEIIADKLSASVLSWECSSQINATGRVLYTADAYRDDGKRFTVIADEKLTAFLELERVTRESLRFLSAE